MKFFLKSIKNNKNKNKINILYCFLFKHSIYKIRQNGLYRLF